MTQFLQQNQTMKQTHPDTQESAGIKDFEDGQPGIAGADFRMCTAESVS